ncbi:MAG: DUF2194 domain-containing protein [Anaerolineae bacterium]|nr:DUF2194 domain-containing protein [Anaerolineae bacterium]
MKQNSSFLLLFFPLAIFLIISSVLLAERTGVVYGQTSPIMKFLTPQDAPQTSPYVETSTQCLVLYNSSEDGWQSYYQTVLDTVDNMRVKCDWFDDNSVAPDTTPTYDLSHYKTVVVTFRRANSETQFGDLVKWVASGGRVLFATPPSISSTFLPYIHELGIRSLSADTAIKTKGINFVSDLMPGAKDVSLTADDIWAFESLPVVLDKRAVVHMTSSDENKTPLLWQFNYEKGRFVVINTGGFHNKASRGIIGAAYSLLEDVFVYPVINSSTFYIDDFPAPIPEGNDPEFKNEYNMDDRSFFLKVWWPEMYDLAENYGLRYTGVMIETYNDHTSSPFEQQFNSSDDFRYMGGFLLKSGGQLGFHGYNHIPLCMEAEGANQVEGYPSWPSTDDMSASLNELNNFGHMLFPGREFTIYVPPSNILCPAMRTNLPKVLPELKGIGGVYLPDTDTDTSYVQEFSEAPDGIIEMPRISAGYWIGEYTRWAIINELSLHYVNSHFVHPDDVLDGMRSAGKPWKELRNDFEQFVQWIVNSTPGMRQMTAEDGLKAVQRYSRLKVNTIQDQNQTVIQLGNFYDEAWLMLRSSSEPKSIEGGTYTRVTSSLYLIHAENPEVKLKF